MTTVPHDQVDGRQELPPHNLAAEQSVLGAMMLSAEAVAEVTAELDREDFYRPAHQAILDAILSLFNTDQPHDAVMVAAELERSGELGRVGGAPYLHTCLAVMPTSVNAGFYAEIVREHAITRRVSEAATRIAQDAERVAAFGTTALLDRAQGYLDAVTCPRAVSGLVSAADFQDEFLSRLDDEQAGRVKPGLNTGFLDLDGATGGGLHAGQLVIIAARPGVGKSALAADFARAATIHAGATTAFFSLEMSRNELTQRLVAAEARVRLTEIRTPGGLTPEARDRITRTYHERIAPAPLYIDDTPNMTVTDIRAKARRLRASHNLGLVIVDYLQLLTTGRRAENRQVEVADMSRSLKILAKELDVPVVALSQLNRGPEQRTDKRPMLSDLRESGSLEQDADLVILISRPDAADRNDPRIGETDLILAKNRMGPTTTITVSHQLHYSRFSNLAHQNDHTMGGC